MNSKDFITAYYPAAIEAAKGSKIFPQTIIAAAAIESGQGSSLLAAKYNNFFGRKPEKNYKGKVVNLPTKEFVNDAWITIKQPFKFYDTPQDSFKDYVRLLSNSKRYAKVLSATTPQDQFKEIQAAGYATAPTYADTLSDYLDKVKEYLPAAIKTGGALLVLAVLFFLATRD